MANALEGLRVIELGSGPAIGMAGMVLADFGAQVLHIPPLSRDPTADLPAAPMWGRGKHRLKLNLDISGDLDEFHQLCRGADVLLCNWRPSALQKKSLDFDSLHKLHPHLINCQISGFGNHGPLSELPGYEHVAAAIAGRMQLFNGIAQRPGPVFSAVQVGVHVAAQSAVAGILAAWLEKTPATPGRRVETSLLQGMLPYDMGGMIGLQFPERFAKLLPFMQVTDQPGMPSLYYHPAQAADGRWMQFGNLLPHLFDNFLIATDLIDVIADPAFDAKQLLLTPSDKHEAFRERMLTRIQDQSSDSWMDNFVADGGIVATTYQSTQDALSDEDVSANGHVIALGDDGLQIGPLARLSENPALPGQMMVDDDEYADAWKSSPRPAPTESIAELMPERRPLAGIRVVEIATIIAAPLGASLLADMGADVIKVEQVGGDPFRGMLAGLGAARVNAGKRSISVNLKSPDGRKTVLDLIATADVLIHNYRPGVPERLGIGYDDVRAINPGLIYLQSNGYGPDGPGAFRPSTHPIPGAAMGGVMYQMGGSLPSDQLDFASLTDWCSRLMRANELNPDPNTAVVVASSVMLGLSARKQTGNGQRVSIDMFGANAYANADDFLRYPGKPSRAMPDPLLQGLSPTYRLYPCADDQWIFFAAITPTQQQAFIDTLAGAGVEAPVANVLEENDEQTATALAALFATDTADAWQALLVPANVACVRADGLQPSEFWRQDSHSQALGLTQPAQHAELGSYQRHGSVVHFDGLPTCATGAPLAGEHNQQVLSEIGYDDEKIQALIDDGALWAQAISSE